LNKIKCHVCGFVTDNNDEVCPSCGARLESIQEDIETNDMTKNNLLSEVDVSCEEQEFSTENNDSAITQVPRTKKGVKIASLVMAIVMLMVGTLFWYVNYSPEIYTAFFDIEDIDGKFSDDLYGMYYDFSYGDVEADVIVSSTSDASSNSDAVLSKTEKHTFDGSFTRGYTDEFIDEVIMGQYISQNQLSDEYNEYISQKDIVTDDFKGFIKSMDINIEKILSSDDAKSIRQEGESYKTPGYWDYDEAKKEISVYDENGIIMTTLIVKKEGLVDKYGYLEGKTKKNSKFNSKLSLRFEEYQVTQTMTTYDDGNLLIKMVYDNGGENIINGTYKVKDGFFVLEMEDGTNLYKIISDGIADAVFTK